MGQAKRRGTFEERYQQAMNRKAANLLKIKAIREDLIANQKDITPVLTNPQYNRTVVLALATMLSSSLGIQFHMPQAKEKEING